jgi:type II secretory ATPase GspE/PulE/Tfp pilus assembly ATPase PilB-like protein
LCPECAQGYQPSPAELGALELDPSWLGEAAFKRPRGCKVCEGSGYRGRVGLFETLELDPALREMIFRGANLGAIRAQSLASGRLRPILRDGAEKLVAGVTSLAELARVSRLAADEAA